MTSQFVGSSLALGSALTAWCLLGILSPLSAPPALAHTCACMLSLSNKYLRIKIKKGNWMVPFSFMAPPLLPIHAWKGQSPYLIKCGEQQPPGSRTAPPTHLKGWLPPMWHPQIRPHTHYTPEAIPRDSPGGQGGLNAASKDASHRLILHHTKEMIASGLSFTFFLKGPQLPTCLQNWEEIMRESD